jgi:sialidase-1
MSRHRLTRICALLAFVAACAPAAGGQPPAPQEAVVFAAGDEGYHTFRIPAVIASQKGALLAFCEGRKNGRGDSGDIDLVLKRSTDGGETWGPLQVVADHGADTVGNPCPVVDRTTGRVWLPLTRNPGNYSEQKNKTATGPGSREVLICHSDDDGATWSEPQNITARAKKPDWGWYATGPGCGIQLADGRLVIPCDHRVAGAPDEKASHSHVIFSDDHGKTWQIGGTVADDKTNECQVVELDDGTLLLNMRSHHGRNRRAVATSRDRGETWSEATFDDALIEPTCQASMIRLADSNAILFANPASKKRERMTVRLSRDGGKTWPAAGVLYDGPAAYSSLVALPDGRAGCLFEKGKYESIVFARFDLGWVSGRTPR